MFTYDFKSIYVLYIIILMYASNYMLQGGPKKFTPTSVRVHLMALSKAITLLLTTTNFLVNFYKNI